MFPSMIRARDEDAFLMQFFLESRAFLELLFQFHLFDAQVKEEPLKFPVAFLQFLQMKEDE